MSVHALIIFLQVFLPSMEWRNIIRMYVLCKRVYVSSMVVIGNINVFTIYILFLLIFYHYLSHSILWTITNSSCFNLIIH